MLYRLQFMKTPLATLILLIPIFAAAQEVKVPNDVKPFVEKGFAVNALESGDLNGDGIKDHILVISKPPKDDGSFDDGQDDKRQTLVLIRDASGKLSLAYTFNYSRRDKTWELTRVEEGSFNALEPNKEKNSVYTPPKSFGLINFADFNPEKFKGKGNK